jgi:type II secretory pathway component PulF
MNLSNDIDKTETHIEKKSDSSAVLTTFIKYATYIVIFFGILYFLIHYIIPKF